jgi:hypothetical protein
MTCPCDQRSFPPALVIPAGLSDLPRQLAGFPEVRAAMLALIPQHPALAGWRARGRDDFGVMLLEMWAYVADVLAFYDKLTADESYLRTAKLRPSVRKLVSLLGYVPVPAVAAAVRLALLAEGTQPLAIPIGTAFRSAAFGAEPPQVFEVDAAATIYPPANQWRVAPPAIATLSGTQGHLLIQPGTSKIKDGDRILVDWLLGQALCKVTATARMTDAGGKTWVRVELTPAFSVPFALPVSLFKVYRATRTAQLRSPVIGGEEDVVHELSAAHLNLQLDAIYTDVKSGDRVFVSRGEDYRWASLIFRSEETYVVNQPPAFTDSGGGSVTPPAVKARFTMLHLNPSVRIGPPAWSNADAPDLTVHFGLVDAGRVGTSDALVLADSDPIVLGKVVAPASGPPAMSSAFLVDAERRGVELGASLDWTTGRLTANPGTGWSPPLVLPVAAYGNVVSATRGQTVPGEALGSGDATANQAFELAKKPLTYVASPTADNEAGVASTLAIWVDGVAWRERPSFFGQGPTAHIYLVRHKDDGTAVVTFGDGVHGAVLPSGARVAARYRFGAGAASPPAGAIAQLARPVKGLKRVVNPVAAAGGAEAEPASQIRALAPRSALLLGRAVSLLDMEAAAAAVPGVIAAAAAWRWEGTRQRPVVKVWYIGGAGLELTVSRRLRSITDPSTPIDVDVATPIPAALSIDVETDPAYVAADVVIAVQAALLDPAAGLLASARIGIGKPLYRSRIFEAVLDVAGARSVRAIQWRFETWSSYARQPPAGSFFDFAAGHLLVTGSAHG